MNAVDNNDKLQVFALQQRLSISEENSFIARSIVLRNLVLYLYPVEISRVVQ